MYTSKVTTIKMAIEMKIMKGNAPILLKTISTQCDKNHIKTNAVINPTAIPRHFKSSIKVSMFKVYQVLW
jgi:hypothetical protein